MGGVGSFVCVDDCVAFFGSFDGGDVCFGMVS
jgi:hypothetical protein